MSTATGVHSPQTARNLSASEQPSALPRPSPLLLSSSLAPILLIPVVLLVHGYHPFAGDAGIYVAGVRHILDPALYPLNAAFVMAFAKYSAFPWAMAALVRLSHLPLSTVLFAAHLLSIFLFLSAFRSLAGRLFAGESARWCSTLLAAACFTLPVAGTALFIMDPYVTARSFSTPLSLMAVAACIDRAWRRTVLLLAITALIHPLMALYTAAFVALHALVTSGRVRAGFSLCIAALVACRLAFALARSSPVSAAYLQAISLPPRTFLFLARWRWYEMLGLALPLLLFALALRRLGPADRKGALCLTCLLLGITSCLVAALFVPPSGPCLLVRFQVLRSFHAIYALGIVLSGGVLAALFTRSRLAAASLIIVLFAGMFAAQRFAWSGSRSIEWPGSQPSSPWQHAFLWIRNNTPRDAVFAFDPRLVYLPEEDEQGFRAITERDHLADDKDAGIVAVFPSLADRWAQQRNPQFSVNSMTDAERIAALTPLGARWLLLPPDSVTTFACPYRNRVVQVCRMSTDPKWLPMPR